MLIDRQKINLNKLLEKYSFQYLRPPPTVFQVQIPQSQIFISIGGGKKKRKIYYKVTYSQQEVSYIRDIRKMLSEYQIFEKQFFSNKGSFTDQIILKHLYASSMNHQKTLQRLFQLQKFHNNPIITTFTEDTLKNLKKGALYIFGRDRGMRPIIILRCDRFDTSLSIQQNYNAVYFMLLIVIGFMMVPYHAQKYVFLVDINNMSFSDIPYKYLFEVLTKMGTFYCGNVEKTIIFNYNSAKLLWSIASRFIPQHSRKRILFIEKGEQQKVLQYIDPYELQKKYGGKLQNQTQYWPPKTASQFDNINRLEQSMQTAYYSVIDDNEYFKEVSNTFCGCGSQCVIY